jgi:hypothetical protein
MDSTRDLGSPEATTIPIPVLAIATSLPTLIFPRAASVDMDVGDEMIRSASSPPITRSVTAPIVL